MNEQDFLKPFIDQAKNGQIVVVSDIKKTYEKITREQCNLSTIYYLLHRNGWRKIMSRSKHPKKASDEAIRLIKKITDKTHKMVNLYSDKFLLMFQDEAKLLKNEPKFPAKFLF